MVFARSSLGNNALVAVPQPWGCRSQWILSLHSMPVGNSWHSSLFMLLTECFPTFLFSSHGKRIGYPKFPVIFLDPSEHSAGTVGEICPVLQVFFELSVTATFCCMADSKLVLPPYMSKWHPCQHLLKTAVRFLNPGRPLGPISVDIFCMWLARPRTEMSTGTSKEDTDLSFYSFSASNNVCLLLPTLKIINSTMFNPVLEDHNRFIVSSVLQLKSIGATVPSSKTPLRFF